MMNQSNLKKYTKEEMEEYSGDVGAGYDESGNFCLPDGTYFDANGYFYDQDGYDEQGGYFDQDGNYIVEAEYDQQDDEEEKYTYADFDSSSKGVKGNYYNYNQTSNTHTKRELDRLKQEIVEK